MFVGVWPRLAVATVVVMWGWTRSRAAARRMLADPAWDLEVLATAVLFATCMTLSAIALGAIGQLRHWTWALASLLGFLALGARARAIHPTPSPAGDFAAPSSAFVIGMAGLLIGRMVFTLRNPPADWDSLHYHFPMAAFWMQSGTIGVAMRQPPAFGSYFPGNGELLQTFAAFATGRETLMPWAALLGLGLLALASRRLALMAGARAPLAEGAAACVAAGPGVVQLTLGLRVDHLLAAWFAIGLLFAFRLRRADARGDAALALCALGLAAGTKSTGPVYATLAVIAAVAGAGGGTRLRALLAPRAALASALVLGGVWFLRNAIGTGNPLFPAQVPLGPWKLPGLMTSEALKHTSQLIVWREGYAGHMTLANVRGFFGGANALVALGLPLWAWTRARRPRNGHDEVAVRLVLLALACLVFNLFLPFSAAYQPAQSGHPPALNMDNLRLLLPVLVATAPVAAAGLSALPASTLVGVLLSCVMVLGLRNKFGHLLPGIALAVALFYLVTRLAPRARVRPLAGAAALGLIGSVALALAVARVDAARDRLSDRIWDGYICRINNLPAATLRSLRESARGRPIAIVGLHNWCAYYGRDFSGHPVYVPVATAWEARARAYQLRPESRARPDARLWRDNLARSGAAYVVVGALDADCAHPLPEAGWCASDTARFAPIAARSCDVVYRVREADALARDGAEGGR